MLLLNFPLQRLLIMTKYLFNSFLPTHQHRVKKYFDFTGDDSNPGPQPVYAGPGQPERQSRQRNFNTGCCNSLSLSIQGNLQNFHANLDTTFNRNQNINGFPTWRSTDGQKAIWHAAKTWCLGDIKDFGSRICQVHSIADTGCPSDISKNNWRYWTGSEFTNVKPGDLNVLCQGGMTYNFICILKTVFFQITLIV